MLVIFAHWLCTLRLLKLLIGSRNFGAEMGFAKYIQLCHLQTETTWLPPFLFGYPLFLSLIWLLWLVLPVLCWIEVVRVGIFVLFQFSEIMLSTFPHSVLFWLWFVIDGFYHIEVCPLYADFAESFNNKVMLDFVKCFFCLYWDNHGIFVFNSVYVMYHIYWLVYVKPFLHPWCETH